MRLSQLAGVPLAMLLTASLAGAQVHKFYGEDNNGTETTRATNVNSLAAEAAFKSLLTGVYTETFEDIAVGPYNSSLQLYFSGGFQATLLGSGYVEEWTHPTGANTDRYPISGTRSYATMVPRGGTSELTVSFTEAVAAVGFYGVDLGDRGADLTLRFFLGSTLIDTWTPYTPLDEECNNAYCGSIKYFGYINGHTFDRVEFLGGTLIDRNDVFALDDLTAGLLEQIDGGVFEPTTVPEPATVVLLGVGLGAVAMVRRRRRA